MGDVMVNEADEYSSDQFYIAFIIVDEIMYGEQDLIAWDETQHYKLEDLKLDVV